MNEKNVQGFKDACYDYLSSYALTELRVYGRKVGVENPTIASKETLLTDIVAVLSGEKPPVKPSKRGAPVKSDHFNPQIEVRISELRYVYGMGFTERDRSNLLAATSEGLFARSPDLDAARAAEEGVSPYFTGQLETVDGISCLIPLDGDYTKEKAVVSQEVLQAYRLRDGDVIAAKVKDHYSVLVVTEIMSINGVEAGQETRYTFGDAPAVTPNVSITFSEDAGNRYPEARFVDWFAPMGYGQRCLIYSPPKSGKTSFALRLVDSLYDGGAECEKFALLIGQTPETVFLYKEAFGDENVVARSYDDSPEQQVSAVEFMIKRVKRYMEMSKNVVLFIDSFTEIAKAYEDFGIFDDGKRLPSGISTDTLRRLKQLFGLARATERHGSVTVIGTHSTKTGNPMDDDIFTALRSIANCEIALSEELARRRVFPAIDLSQTFTCEASLLMTRARVESDYVIRNRLLPKYPNEVREAVLSSLEYEEFFQKVSKLP